MIDIVATLCLLWTWAPPADFEVDYYNVWVDEIVYAEFVGENVSQICVEDWEEHKVEVQAISVNGLPSEFSDPTYRVFHGPRAPGIVCSDLDGNNVTGMSERGSPKVF